MSRGTLLLSAYLLLALLALGSRPLLASGLANRAALLLLKAAPCAPDVAPCVLEPRPYPPPRPDLAGPLGTLAARLDSLSPAAHAPDQPALREAELLFALGRVAEAAALLPPLDTKVPELGGEHVAPLAPSPLLHADGYQRALLAAYQHVAAEGWVDAVSNFRLAMALGGPRLTEGDYQTYWLALARHGAAQGARPTPTELGETGYYFARAGEWEEATRWLDRARTATGFQALPTARRLRLLLARGQAHERAGEPAAARAAYEEAHALAPERAAPLVRLLALLHGQDDAPGAEASRAALSQVLPPHTLTGQGTQATLADGWTLVGYEVDEEALAAGGPLDIVLWWQGEKEASGHPGWLSVGAGRWVEQRQVVNLAPNPDFEWALSPSGLPLGYASSYFSSAPAGIALREEGDEGSLSHRLEIASAGQLGLRTYPILTDPDGLYLSAAWLRPEGGKATFGRKCFTPGYPSAFMNHLWGVPTDPMQVVAALSAPEGSDKGSQVANLARPLPDQRGIYCQLFLEVQGGRVEVDHVLFTLITVK